MGIVRSHSLAVAAIVSILVIPISILVNRVVPQPYMDEIFHIPQAQQYCNGSFRSWDPMITTPPGLYCLSLAHVASLFPGMFIVQSASSLSDVCSVAILRSINGVLAVICSILVYETVTHLRPALDKRKATLCAVVLALYPLHWFFIFLYYTDVASLTAVLAMYLACLKKKYMFSALNLKTISEEAVADNETIPKEKKSSATIGIPYQAISTESLCSFSLIVDFDLGALAIVIRQTNIIWMLFIACIGIIDITLAHRRDDLEVYDLDASIRKNDHLIPKKFGTSDSNLRKRKSVRAVDAVSHSLQSTSDSSAISVPGLLDEIKTILLTSWNLKWELLVTFSPFFMVLVAFIAFVHWNGSVVLGAKEAHAVSPHFAQMLYFSLVSALAMAPLLFTLGQAADLFQSLWRNRPLSFVQVFVVFIAGFSAVHFFSIAHPYLLADNRHYPFYLWRKVIKSHWSMKYLLVPFYVYSWLSICYILGRVQRKIWVFAYFLASAAVLVPAPLIEFRYYTIPFYFLILHSHIYDSRKWLLMGILYVAVNAFTMMMFLFRPFYWNHEPGIQRFIW